MTRWTCGEGKRAGSEGAGARWQQPFTPAGRNLLSIRPQLGGSGMGLSCHRHRPLPPRAGFSWPEIHLPVAFSPLPALRALPWFIPGHVCMCACVHARVLHRTRGQGESRERLRRCLGECGLTSPPCRAQPCAAIRDLTGSSCDAHAAYLLPISPRAKEARRGF